MSTPLYPTVSSAEYVRRTDAIRRSMTERDLDALVLYGEASSAGANLANCVYLTGYEDPWFSYVVLLRDGAPLLLNSNPLYLPYARTTAVVDGVDTAGWDPGTRVADLLRTAGVATGRIGVAGARGIHTSTPPHQHHERMVAALPDASFEDATSILQTVRRRKSAEEVDLLRRGAQLTDATVAALERDICVGMSEHQLGGIIHQAAAEGDGVQRLVFIGSTAMDDPQLVFPRQMPSTRRVREGDVVLTELSTSYGGYAGQIHRPMTVGVPATPEYRRLFDASVEVLDAVLGALRPGATDEDVRAAARPVLEATDTWTMDTLLHGWGLSIEPPRLDVVDRSVIERPQEPTVFEPGMVVVVQPHLLSADRSIGLQVGSLAVVTEDGVDALQRHPLDLPCVGDGPPVR